jgi:peptide/nickel transport system permease protein
MIQFVGKRLLDLIPTLFVVSLVIFIITRLLPGDPASVMLGPQASVEDVEALRVELGLDQPFFQQLLHYFKDLLQLDFGTSAYYNEPVLSLIMDRFPNTLLLAVSALAIALLVGVPAGMIAAAKRNSVIDYLVTFGSLVGVSMPVFWLGVMFVLFFSVQLGWLPATGMGSLDNGLWDFFKYLLLPSVTLATIPMAEFARITRSSMLEVGAQDYIKTARAKGLKEFWVISKHAFKNALTPLLTVTGMQVSMLLGGAVLTETIYAWPGMGRMIVDAIDKRDFIVVQGSVLFIALIFVLVNLVVDLLYKVVNPRVDLNGSKGGTS